MIADEIQPLFSSPHFSYCSSWRRDARKWWESGENVHKIHNWKPDIEPEKGLEEDVAGKAMMDAAVQYHCSLNTEFVTGRIYELH